MNVGVEIHWRLNGIKSLSMRARTKEVMSFESPPIQSCFTVAIFASRPDPAKHKAKYSTVKCKHFFGSFGSLRQSS